MGDPKFDQSGEERERHSIAVEKYPARNGFIYELYFVTEAEAEEGVRAFWNTREHSGMVRQGLQSGMLRPFNHDITSGDRTAPRKANPSDLRKHPDKPFVVQFNGNTEALSPEGEAALRSLNFIE